MDKIFVCKIVFVQMIMDLSCCFVCEKGKDMLFRLPFEQCLIKFSMGVKLAIKGEKGSKF